MTTTLLPLAVTAEPLLRAIAANPSAKSTVLAQASGRNAKHIARDLEALCAAGLYAKLTGEITALGLEQLAMLDRAHRGFDLPRDPAPGDGAAGDLVLHAQIMPDPNNPRKDWDSRDAEDAIAELADSIAAEGLLQNLVVRPARSSSEPPAPDGAQDYILIAGERRWRAIGHLIEDGRWPADKPIRVLIADLDAQASARVALIENLKRRDLKPLEEARAFQALVDGGMKTAEIAQAICATQRLVQQRLQLLELDEKDQARLEAGKLTIEQARNMVANRPPLPDLSPVARMLLAELIDAGERAQTSLIDVGPGHEDNSALQALKIEQLVHGPWPEVQYGMQTGQHVQVGYRGKEALRREYPAFDKERQGVLLRLRGLALGDSAQALPAGVYATPWLNGPFDPPPEVQAAIDEAKAAQARERAEQDAKRLERDERRREDFAAARTATLDLRSFANARPPEALHAQVKPIAEQARAPVPWRFRPWLSQWKPSAIVAANGADVAIDRDNSDGEEARFRLIIVAVNAAAGLPTPEDIEAEQVTAAHDADADDDLDDDDDENEDA